MTGILGHFIADYGAERQQELRDARTPFAPKRSPPAAGPLPRPAAWSTRAASLRNVSLRYGDGPLVVDNVALDITPGSSVALVGGTGSGKTSLLNLLARIVPPTKGTSQPRATSRSARSAMCASLSEQ